MNRSNFVSMFIEEYGLVDCAEDADYDVFYVPNDRVQEVERHICLMFPPERLSVCPAYLHAKRHGELAHDVGDSSGNFNFLFFYTEEDDDEHQSHRTPWRVNLVRLYDETQTK